MKTENIIYAFEEAREENEAYLNEQIITYIGNKRSLLSFINEGINIIKTRLDKNKLSFYDVFSGSGIVARYFKKNAEKIIVNDIERYSEIINTCYLTNHSEIDDKVLKDYYNEIVFKLENEKLINGFISELYAPKDDENVKNGERVFYTNRNAKYIDTARHYIESVPKKYRPYFLAPLLSEASIHANTSGVFKGFYKNSKTGVGQFGGNGSDALLRILGDIHLPFPVFSNYECEYQIHCGDSNIISDCLEEVDIAYLDPPYNQHPYGSNYFMLNLIVDYIKPNDISKVSGIPTDWKRSLYNKRAYATETFNNLLEKIKAKYLIVSFNSEGFISKKDMVHMLKKFGKVDVIETKYNTFRGSRNLRNRTIHIKEYLYLVERK
ncbi:DNA modification methylase [Marispirochaeta aestuarii]|uniref:site-specific DNA-methyltransferase (adenine-specific) n=1 Tax=Marispirochaeta aestuarii TaxID=1963862 RepID=A0A1Y1RW97_9SPIO|nr:DNA adenine methylase [Marispirochaeta aestuarii]ORC33843.1 DNA modification methylase [Marispirochaeta aestuarii]